MSKPSTVTTLKSKEGDVSALEETTHITVLYGKLQENGHLEHRDGNVNP